MFGVVMLYEIGREVYRTDVVAKDNSSSPGRSMEFMLKLPEPARFCTQFARR